MGKSELQLRQWGLLDYGLALERLRRRHGLRVAGLAPDALILVEHPPALTQGRHGQAANVLASPGELSARGVVLYHIERGGDVTYHGPGQAVVYPVLHLAQRGLRVRGLVEALLEAAQETVAYYGVRAQPDFRNPGLWVGRRKLAAVGLAVKERVSLHGLALNVTTQLEDFLLIKGCGLEAQPTSLARELGRPLPAKAVGLRLLEALAGRLGCCFSD
ncbi:Octanoyltransferase [Desulfarculales bacterium]